jgi:hypothetical protein
MAVRPVHQERIFQKDKSPEELEQERKLIADKTNEAKVLLAAKTARYATPIGQNTLFCLPRELRDISTSTHSQTNTMYSILKDTSWYAICRPTRWCRQTQGVV